MALVIINRSAPEANETIRLRNYLRSAQEVASYLNDIQANASDADLETVFGIPAADASSFRTVIGNLDTAMQAAAIENFINNVG